METLPLRILSVALLTSSILATFANAQPGKVLPNPNGVYPGYYHIGDLAVGYGEQIAKAGGNPPPIVFTFHDWNSAGLEVEEPVLQTFKDPMEGDFVTPLQLANRLAQDGSILAVAWDSIGYFFEHPDYFAGGGNQPIKWADIFSGQYDDHIRTVAREIKAFGKPIMLSAAAEYNAIGFVSFGPNGNQYIATIDNPADLTIHYGDPTIPDGPERVRDLYRYVIDIFREEQADNVTWFMYSHTAYMNPAELDSDEFETWENLHPRHYYPGDDYIDWIGNSAYINADDPEKDLAYAVEHVLDAYREFTDKPFIIPEFGVESAAGVNRADRMRELFNNEVKEFDDIRAFAMADGELWSELFDIPRLGHHPEELQVWQEAVWGSDDYSGDVLVEQADADFDADGDIDDDDLSLWKASFGTGLGADADGDLDSDGADFLVWQRQFAIGLDTATNSANLSVPEPLSATLLLLGMFLVGRKSRRLTY